MFPENQDNPRVFLRANFSDCMSHSPQIIFARRFALSCLVLFSFCVAVVAQEERPFRSVTYRLGMSRPASHLFEVTIEVERAKESTAKTIDFQMPKWSPGRYAVFDFAKNVQEFKAFGGICPAS